MTFIFLLTDQIKTINYKLTLFYSSLNHLFMKYFNYKFLMVLLALAMAIPAARAQDELTLYDETTENSYVPFYGLYFDEAGLISQVIYPASDLADLIDTEITGIKFYTNSSGIKMANSQVEISLGTTEQSVFGDMITTGLSAVATIAITGDGAQVLEIQFENAFTYTGGNLVFQSKTLVSGSWKATSFIGKDTGSQNYTGYCNKASTKKQTFLPKTTFIYTGEKADYALKVNPAEGLNFGNLTPNVSKTLSLTIKNNGANAVTPTLSSVSAPFSFEYTPAELAPSQSITIPVTYNPTSTGNHTASIVINTTGNLIDDIVVPLTGNCVNEITLYETPDTYDEEVPLYKPNYYLGASQMIYPEADLAGMVNKKIKGFKFYLYNTSAFNGKYNVSIGTTDQTEFEYNPTRITGLTPVVTGATATAGVTEFNVTFDDAFTYTGGNLVIDLEVTEKGTPESYSSSIQTLGIATDSYTSFRGHVSYGTLYLRGKYFLPTITFALEEDETPVEKVDPEMEFEPDEVTVYVGATEFTAPTLTTTPADMTVTYRQEGDVDVALVDETSGEVLIGDKTGDVVITANFAGDDNYNPGSASYTIHVVNKPELTVDEAVEFEATVGETKSKTFGVLGTDLQGDVTLTLNDETGYFTIDPVTITKAAAEELAEVTVTYTPMAEGIHEATVTVTSKDAEPKTVSLSAIAIIPTPAVAAPTFNVPEGEYTEAQNIVITCATEGANISYSTDGGNSWTSGHFVVLKEDTELMAKAEKDGETATATAIYFITLPEPAQVAPIDGYFRIKNLGNNKYANIAGRKTMNFTDAPADKAGTVIRVVTNENGQVQVLRSQGADLQRYADRAMTYIPEIVRLVVDKLNADEPGGILGESGLDKILQKFNEEFDYHLYVEPAEGGYRIYGKTPSMQPVVDFYFENKAKVDEKLPQLQDFVNQAIDKILEKTEGHGASILVDYSIAEVWQRMGGQLTQPVDEASTMKFYEEVLTNKDNVWNFAYQSAMIYWEKLKANDTFLNYVNEMGDFAQYLDRVEQIRPDFKYYIAQLNDKPDFISQGNKDVNAARNIWALEENTAFTVNFPAENLNSGKYVTTLYTDFAYDLPEGVTAYKVTGYTNLGDANLEALSGTVPAQTPVILMAAEAGNQTLTVNMDNGTAPSGNLLVGPDYLITTYSIKTPMVENIFNMAKGLMGEEFYNNYLAQYEHLMLKNAGTVNNKYFWGLPYDDVKGCTYMNENDEKECVVRSLDVEDGRVAFYNNTTVSTNKAFLVSEEFNVIRLGLRGDVNRDGKTTIADVTALIDILLTDPVNPSALPQFDYIAADFNENGQIKINDVTALIDYLLANDL